LTKGLHTGRYSIEPGTKVDFDKFDPSDTSGFEGKKEDEPEESERLKEKLRQLQEVLWAEHKRKILIVLQAMDTAGKDGVIRRVFDGVNPQGVRVAHFGLPTPEEHDHDFLWRAHKEVPGSGLMTIFNRSHYEGVLIERVHKLISEETEQQRYKEINHFEKLLSEDDTTVLKFYLHISKDEQKKRLQARLDDPSKHWKFSVNDLPERKLWEDYMEVYENTLSQTSTEWAPWYIIPSNHKWFRDLLVSHIIVRAMEKLDLQYPKVDWDPATITIK
jgi:PPK2 family polyphosphate:nucleotide phosphotransferase